MTDGKMILLIEDDAAIALIIRETLMAEGLAVHCVATIAGRERWLESSRPQLVITDVVLPDGDGLESLSDSTLDPAIPIIVLSAQNTLDTAVRAADFGSYDYLPKPFDLGDLTASVQAALTRSGVDAPASPAATTQQANYGLIGRAPAMQTVYRTIARLASNDLAVLILGESGTGKEVVAEAIHATGLRRSGPFVAINMAAIPRELIEAELFGHEKGAFTGAVARSAGRFEQAAGGTLFLDEIGDMPLEAQTRLLRVLQSNEYSSVGGHQSLRADVRVIAATHRDIEALVAEGGFREDLYYRLNVIPIQLPPLRERRSDIAALAEHFIAQGRRYGLPDRRFSDDAMRRLVSHDWPGNVRELGNVVQRLAVLARDVLVTAKDVDAVIRSGGDATGAPTLEQQVADAIDRWAAEQLGDDPPTESLHDAMLAIAERALLSRTLRETNGNQLEAARRLGINRNTLRKRLVQLRIDPARP